MIYRLTKLDGVIAKVIRDLGLGSEEIPFLDFVDWSAEALADIGSYPQLEERYCNVIIKDYSGKLPCDLHKVNEIVCLQEVTSKEDVGFYAGTIQQYWQDNGIDMWKDLDESERGRLAVPSLSKGESLNNSVVFNGKGLNYTQGLYGPQDKVTSRDYNINFDTINTGFREGIVYVKYLAFPVDKETGWPMVPEDVTFFEALFWKVAYQLCMRSPEVLRNPQMRDLEYCRMTWERKCQAARSEANMPDMEMMIRLKNNFTRLYNTIDDDLNRFSELGRNQRLDFEGWN